MSSKTVTYFVVIKVSCLVHCFVLGKVRFLLGGGGGGRWAGASEGRQPRPLPFFKGKALGTRLDGRVLSNFFFTNWAGSNLFYSQPREGHSFLWQGKITPCRFYFVYTSKATSQD